MRRRGRNSSSTSSPFQASWYEKQTNHNPQSPKIHFSNLGPADLRGVPARPLLAEVQRAGGLLGTHDGTSRGTAKVCEIESFHVQHEITG